MTGLAKFLVGAAATSLLAWGAHALTGEDYINGLEGNAQEAFAGMDAGEGATVAMARDPLARTAIVFGVTDQAEQDRIRAELLALPGIGAVSFADEADGDAAGSEGDGEDAAAVAAVAECQSDIDEVMAGKVINFRSGSAYMPDTSLAVVDEVAAALSNCPDLAVTVEGHTDATGSVEVNTTLSQARADAVAAALTERGVEATRVSSAVLGSSEPVVEGMTVEANAANRRIEFELASGTAAPADEGE